jgi:hypothetical protein
LEEQNNLDEGQKTLLIKEEKLIKKRKPWRGIWPGDF